MRRGVPATIISDNAKTFKQVQLEVKELMKSSDVQRQPIKILHGNLYQTNWSAIADQFIPDQ